MKKGSKSKAGSKAMFQELEDIIRDGALQGYTHLWEKNEDKIHEYRTEDGVNHVKVGISIDIKTPNGDGGEPEIGVDMTVTKSFKDGIKVIMDPANQGRFEFVVSTKGTPRPKKGKAKKGESEEPQDGELDGKEKSEAE